jgi:type IV pilus assembly protein PilE
LVCKSTGYKETGTLLTEFLDEFFNDTATTEIYTGGKSMKSRVKGFSLVELMVTVAIVGVIAAIAVPSYQGYIRDTNIAQASSDLKGCAMAVERYYSNGFTYVGADTASVCNTNSPTEGETRFTISFSLSATAFTLTATPTAACGGDCPTITLDQTGNQTVTEP